MARFSRSVILLKTGQGMICSRSGLCGPGTTGGALSKSVPMLKTSRNCSSVRPPGGPAAFGVRFRGTMTGPNIQPPPRNSPRDG